MSLVMTKNLAHRIEQSEMESLESRLKAVEKIEGNPMDVDIRKFGNTTAFSVKNIPGPSFNRVLGISEENEENIDPILDFYQEKDIPARFEITPAHASLELLQSLSKKGYFQCGFHNTLCGSLSNNYISTTEPDRSISVRELKQDEYAIFGDIYTKGFDMPSFLKEHVAQNNQVLHNNKNWTFYIASYKREPAGIGVLFEYNDVGTLAASATLPEFRNKGVHSALISKRLEKARQLNCTLIVGQAKYGSASHRNMERVGMKIAYTKVIWVKS
ncbi:acetyltransferase (GNAT) family protein [Scopulibacillus darangshiensis]|uniref:Acetyltransferase (GNAT) family protein n=1 Tax=Scopulibacillus darangshiensis TaxID=442528 RepID=A0A4R2NJ01_9BACL|nr:GNAT family N-acetyltransferase [Scopulibacillus darangshiensis]TCP21483.1 acetyltransferase (GNAT) family protein [Scopulibacillus darangshiensis]